MTTTKADLIAILVEKGLGSPAALKRRTVADLSAMVGDSPTGDLLVPARDVQVGDVWPGGVKITAVKAGKKWSYLSTNKNADYSIEILSDLLVTVTR